MCMISVIVPVYKVEKYLGQCVDSILNQSFQNFELILVDDGSPDRCPEMCDHYLNVDSRIRVIHKKNGGLSDARNRGIEQARGEYLAFVDSDDFLMPDMLEVLYKLCVKYSAQMSCCGYYRCEDSDTLSTVKLPELDVRETAYAENRMQAFMSAKGIGAQAWSKLYDSALFQEIRYPVGKYHEDVFTTYKVVEAANKIAVTNKIGYQYRKNPESITVSFSPKRLDSIEATMECARFMEKHYPELVPAAYFEIVSACNRCAVQMAQAGYRDADAEKMIQKLYRQYGKYYIRKTKRISKKLYVQMVKINLQLGMYLSKFFRI